jgi:hypothetical protein
MTASIQALKDVTVCGFAKAALAAALLAAPGMAQGAGMPGNCKQNLNQCSLQIWGRDAFAHPGDRKSITFSDGTTLTCSSNGRGTPRSCSLSGGQATTAPAKVHAKRHASPKAPAKKNASGGF